MIKRKYPVTLVTSILIGWFISLVSVLQFKIVELHNGNANQYSAFPPLKGITPETDALSQQAKYIPFNSFTDVKLAPPYTNEKKPPPYSSFHCVQADQSGYPDYMARTCEYRNLYYKPSDQSFHYYARPHELSEYNGRIADLSEAMTVADGFIRWDKLTTGLESVSTQGYNLTYQWKPTIETVSTDFAVGAQYSIISSPVNPIFVLYLPSYSFNLGHLVFDDLLSIFAMLHMFGYASSSCEDHYQAIPFFVERPSQAWKVNFGSRDPFWRCHPDHADRWSKCIKLWSRVYPSLLGVSPDPQSGDILRSGNWLRGSAAIGEFETAKSAVLTVSDNSIAVNALPRGSDYVLLPTVINGPGRLANWSCKGECAIGRGLWMWEFRRYLLNNIYGQNSPIAKREPPNQGYITISLPTGSTHMDKVTFFEDIIEAAKNRFGADRTKVVDMAKLSVEEQAQLVRQSAVYLTNHGGGSASALFLPRGATLIIYHGIGKQKEPKMLDRHLWNSLGYARVLWVHPVDHHNVEKSMNLIQYSLETFSS